jgi:hypothetical protein
VESAANRPRGTPQPFVSATTKRSGVCVPSHDAASGRDARSWCSCGRGSRASGVGAGYWAEKCVS